MSSTTYRNHADDDLAGALAAEFVQSGRPSVPSGQRERIVALLTGLMADRRRLDDYTESLAIEFERREVDPAAVDRLGLDERDERIAAHGFSELPDELLAALALSPGALEALYEYLEAPETLSGDWLMDAMMAAHGDRPELQELDRHARRTIARLLGESSPPVVPAAPERATRRLPPAVLRWGGGIGSLAASLLLGVLIGTTAFRGGDGSGPFPVTASSSPSPTRGSGEQAGVKVESGRDGFVTVVALAPGNHPKVIPVLGADDVPVRKGGAAVVPVPDEAAAVLALVTETPAGEPVRRALRDKAFEPDRIGELKAFLKSALEAKGYRRIGFGEVSLGK